MKPISTFRYFIGEGLFCAWSRLFRSLDAALLECSSFDTIRPIPSGHAPAKAFSGQLVSKTSAFRPDLPGWAWRVLRVSRYSGDDRPYENYLAAFSNHRDAFAFASLKEKQRKADRDTCSSFYVCFHGWTEDGRQPELARMSADHLTRLRQARDRAALRKERLAAAA